MHFCCQFAALVGVLPVFSYELHSVAGSTVRTRLKLSYRELLNLSRTSQAALRGFNDLFSNKRGYRVRALGQPKRVTGALECGTHRFDQFWIEPCPFKKGVIGTLSL